MWFRPNWIVAQKRAGAASLPIIHETVSQAIQGGVDGEHYHLTAAEHATLETSIEHPSHLEPITSRLGAIMFSLTGDVMTHLVSL